MLPNWILKILLKVVVTKPRMEIKLAFIMSEHLPMGLNLIALETEVTHLHLS